MKDGSVNIKSSHNSNQINKNETDNNINNNNEIKEYISLNENRNEFQISNNSQANNNDSSNNCIISLIEKLSNYSNKELSFVENDYILARKMKNIELEEFQQITEQFDKNSMIELKKKIDNKDLSGNNLLLISTLKNLLKKNYIRNNKNIFIK